MHRMYRTVMVQTVFVFGHYFILIVTEEKAVSETFSCTHLNVDRFNISCMYRPRRRNLQNVSATKSCDNILTII